MITRMLIALGLMMLVGCSDQPAREQTLTVFAAASLSESFEDLGAKYEAEHLDVTVRFSFAGSSDLVTQIENGAPADVIATADTATMGSLIDSKGVAGAPVEFAQNVLRIAVQKGNPKNIGGLSDLTNHDVVICAKQVPCGASTQRLAKRAAVVLHPVSEEGSVSDVLNKVRTGQADAGVVYATDIKAAQSEVDGVTIDGADRDPNRYPIAEVADTKQAQLAREFIDFVTGETGREVLRRHGFQVG